MEENKQLNTKNEKSYLPVISVVVLIGFLVVVFLLYNWVTKKSKGEVVFPAGLNYTGNEVVQPTSSPNPQYDYAKLAASGDWASFTSLKKQYTYKYPKGMIPLVFPGDANDSSSFNVSNVPAQVNLMTLVETVSNYDPSMVGKSEEFVQNYWKFFDGLKASQGLEAYTNEQGLKGYKVNFVTKANVVGTDNYFFFLPDGNRVLHVNNIFPPEGQGVFTRLINSLQLVK